MLHLLLSFLQSRSVIKVSFPGANEATSDRLIQVVVSKAQSHSFFRLFRVDSETRARIHVLFQEVEVCQGLMIAAIGGLQVIYNAWPSGMILLNLDSEGTSSR